MLPFFSKLALQDFTCTISGESLQHHKASWHLVPTQMVSTKRAQLGIAEALTVMTSDIGNRDFPVAGIGLPNNRSLKNGRMGIENIL